MSQPPTYNRQYAFIDFQASNPTDPLPANQHEIELNAIKVTLDAILANMALIQRDDGNLANLSVGNDQLEVSLRTGINAPTVWTVAPTAYSVNDTVVYIDGLGRSELWLALVAHTSTSDFDADSLVSMFWRKLADFSTLSFDASSATYDNTGSALTAEDVQAAIDELDAILDSISSLSDGDKGDITVSSSGAVWAIDDGAVVEAKLATDAVTPDKIQADAVTTAKILDSNVTTNKINNNAVTAGKLATNSVTTIKIADLNVTEGKLAADAVTLDKMEHGTSGDILYYGASGEPFRLAKGTDAQLLTLSSGLPVWADDVVLGANWTLSETTYDFSVDGTVASIETKTLVDGFEYGFAFEALKASGAPGQVNLELFEETTAGYHPSAVQVSAVTTVADDDMWCWGECKFLRDSNLLKIVRVESRADPNIIPPSDNSWTASAQSTTDHLIRTHGYTLAVSEKISKMRFSASAGSFVSGKIYLYERAV